MEKFKRLKQKQININYNACFNYEEIIKSMACINENRVLKDISIYHADDNDFFIHGKVQSQSREDVYFVNVFYNKQGLAEGKCSCHKEYNCEHVIALLIAWQNDYSRLLSSL